MDTDSNRSPSGGHPSTLRFSWTDGDSPSLAVVRAVARLDGRNPVDLPPLFEALDPDSLNAMLEHARRYDTDWTLRFQYAGYEVDLEATGQGVAAPADQWPSDAGASSPGTLSDD